MDLDVAVLGSAFVEFSPSKIRTKLRNVRQFNASAGGSATNLAVSLSRLGLKVGLMSRIGADELGEFVLRDLREEGLFLRGVKSVKGYHTGISLYEIDPLNRKHYFFYRFPGFSDPESTLKQEDIDANYVARAKAFAFTEASVRREPSRGAAFKAAGIAREGGLITLYDPNFRPSLWKSRHEANAISMKAIRLADVVTPNESEAALITGKRNVTQMLKELLCFGPRIVAIKRGARGSIVGSGSQVEVIPAFRVKIMDDTGAGDAFSGGLLYGILKGWPLAKCGVFGNAVAALKMTKRGGKNAMPYSVEVKKFLQKACCDRDVRSVES